MGTSSQLFEGFKGEHREIRDTVYALVEALREGRVGDARHCLGRLDRLAGPHFRYEEEAMYPALEPYFPRGYIASKLGDHDGAIRTARFLAELLQAEELQPEQRQQAAERAVELIIHVSDCDGLAIILERLPEAELQRIAACREAAYNAQVPLLRWASAVRRRVA
jgi:hypothetical protein